MEEVLAYKQGKLRLATEYAQPEVKSEHRSKDIEKMSATKSKSDEFFFRLMRSLQDVLAHRQGLKKLTRVYPKNQKGSRNAKEKSSSSTQK